MLTTPSSSEDQLRDAEQRLTTAEREGDAIVLRALLAPEFAGHGPTGRPMNRSSFIAALTATDRRFERLEIDEVNYRLEGSFGIVCGRSDWTMVTGSGVASRRIVGSCRYLDVWQRRESGWQLLAAAITPVTG